MCNVYIYRELLLIKNVTNKENYMMFIFVVYVSINIYESRKSTYYTYIINILALFVSGNIDYFIYIVCDIPYIIYVLSAEYTLYIQI